MENILQRLIVLQPLLSVDFPAITRVIQSIRTLVVELNAVEDEAQRQVRRGRGRPEIVITAESFRITIYTSGNFQTWFPSICHKLFGPLTLYSRRCKMLRVLSSTPQRSTLPMLFLILHLCMCKLHDCRYPARVFCPAFGNVTTNRDTKASKS